MKTILANLIPLINEESAKWIKSPMSQMKTVETLVDTVFIEQKETLLFSFSEQVAAICESLSLLPDKPAKEAYMNLVKFMMALAKADPNEFSDSVTRELFLKAATDLEGTDTNLTDLFLAADACEKDCVYICEYLRTHAHDLPDLVEFLARALGDRDSFAIVRALQTISSPEDSFLPSTAAPKLYEWGNGYAVVNSGEKGAALQSKMHQIVWRIASRVSTMLGKELPDAGCAAASACVAAGTESLDTIAAYCKNNNVSPDIAEKLLKGISA